MRVAPSQPLLAALLTLLLAACEPPDLRGPLEVWAYTASSEDPHAYSLQPVVVEDLESLRELRGRDVSMRSGSLLAQRTLPEVSLDCGRGEAFDLAWTLDGDGRVVPLDETSLYALTAYVHFSRTAAWLRERGYASHAPLDIYYFPRVESDLLGDLRLGFTDNAAYASDCHAFFLLPSFVLSDTLPLLANAGVVAHEFGHSVVHQQLFGDAPEAAAWATGGAKHHLAAMHEGVADLIGLAVTGDTNILLPSLPSQAQERDVTIPRALTAAALAELNDTLATPAPHVHGSTLARTVFEAWPKAEASRLSTDERDALMRAILASLSTISVEFARTVPRPSLTVAHFANALLLELPEVARPEACRVFLERLAPLAPVLTRCEAP